MLIRTLVALYSGASQQSRQRKAMQLIKSCGISSPVNTLHSHQWTVLFQYDPQCEASADPVDGDGTIRTESVFRCAKTGDFCLVPGTTNKFTGHDSANKASTLSERVYHSLANTKPLNGSAAEESHVTALICIDGRLILQRDMTGLRTLVYMNKGDEVLVSHDEHALLHDEGSCFTINRSRIACHLALAEADPTSTWFNEIHQVRPMHRVMLDGSISTEQRHQAFDYLTIDDSIGLDEYGLQLVSRLDDAVGRTIRATGDAVALAISGGMDSTAVAASVMNRPDAGSQGVSLYSWQFPEHPECDETSWVSDLAAQYQVEWHPVMCTGCEPLGQAFDDIDIPLIAPSIDAYRALRKRMSDQVSRDGYRQLVTGDFGDHLYMGQHYYLQDARKAGKPGAWAAIRSAIRQHGLKGFRRQAELRRLLPFNGLSRRFKKYRAEWLTDMANKLLNSGEPSYVNPVRQPDRIEACLSPTAADAGRYGLSLSQSWGLPHQYPLRNDALIRFMLSLPACLLTDPISQQSKWIMRLAMAERLPSSITGRRGKTTFEPIFTEGVLHRHREKTRHLLNHPNAAWPNYVDHDWVKLQSEPMQFSYTGLVVLWQIISLQLWIDELPANIGA